MIRAMILMEHIEELLLTSCVEPLWLAKLGLTWFYVIFPRYNMSYAS